MGYEFLLLGLPGMQILSRRNYGSVLTKSQSVVCIIAILACKSMGLIKELAKFDNEKAKRCTSNLDNPLFLPFLLF